MSALEETKIPITDLKHRIEVGEFYGAARVLDKLEKRKKDFGALPGYNAALAVAEAHVADCRTRMFSMNVRTAAQAGVDLRTYAVTTMTGEEVICTPILMEECDIVTEK